MESELYHYGVKGMKWGVHRAQKRDAKASKKLASLSRDVQNANSRMMRNGVFKKTDNGMQLVGAGRKDTVSYNKAVKKANKYMSKLEKIYKDPSSRELKMGLEKDGRAYVEARINSSKTRLYYDQFRATL